MTILRRYLLLVMVFVFVQNLNGCTKVNKPGEESTYDGGLNNYSYNSYNDNYYYGYNFNIEYGLGVNFSRKHTIGISMADTNSFFNHSLVKFAMDEAGKQGVDLIIADAKWDVKKQEKQIADFVKQRVDVIIIMPVDPEYLVTSAKLVKMANIPLIDLNIKLDDIVIDLVDSFVGVNENEQAELAAELMIDGLGEKGGNVIMLEGISGNSIQTIRSISFIDKISLLKTIRIIDRKSLLLDSRKAYKTTMDLLHKYPKIDGIYANDDSLILGSVAAAKVMGRNHKIRFVGIGGNDTVYSVIIKGDLYGTIMQSPEWEGTQVIRCAVDILNGKKVKVWYRDPLYKVTKENVEKFKGIK